MRIANTVAKEIGDDKEYSKSLVDNYYSLSWTSVSHVPSKMYLGEFATCHLAQKIFEELQTEALFFINYSSKLDGCKFTAQVFVNWKNRYWIVNFDGRNGQDLESGQYSIEKGFPPVICLQKSYSPKVSCDDFKPFSAF